MDWANVRKAFENRLAESEGNWKRRCDRKANNGLGIFLLKSLTGDLLLKCIQKSFIPTMRRLAWPAAVIARHQPADDISTTYYVASDLYKVVTDLCLLLAYSLAAWMVVGGYSGLIANIAVAFAAALGLFRLTEIMLVIVYLALDDEHVIPRGTRAIVNTLWHFCEIALGFAVLYLVLTFLDANAISGDDGHSLADNPVAAAYFSLITLATIGYGDYSPSPNNPCAMAVVCGEVLCGAFIVLIVVQQSVSAANSK